MYESHPVPQNISSYQFRLVGDMTLKQFLEIAAGVGIALIFHTSGLPFFVRWPAIIVSVLTGAAFAFLPISGRPFEVWVVAFFRSIYTPTLFYWKRTDRQFFAPEPTDGQEAYPETLVEQAAESEGPELSKFNEFLANLENEEKTFLTRIGSLFRTQTQTVPAVQVVASGALVDGTGAGNVAADTQVRTGEQAATQGVEIPRSEPVTIEHDRPPGQPILVSPPAPETRPAEATPAPEPLAPRPLYGQAAPQPPQEAPSGALPAPPEQANVVVGQILTPQGEIIEGAILEITDKEGRPLRALKSNNVGHFRIVTPLVNGTYRMETEKEGYEFDPLEFEARGEIITPILIRAARVAGGKEAQ